MKRIVFAEALPGYRVKLRYDDGVEGVVDLSAKVGHGVFAAWNDPSHFASVKIEEGGEALIWPGDIDLCADALYLEITGLQPQDLFPVLKELKEVPDHA
ncbi:MAG: DUF2442 domain-containing protein [Verrucomicrobiales bacterium]|nr:DUF2442 domain-containing protein [Verrucomicrobiales bacterium]